MYFNHFYPYKIGRDFNATLFFKYYHRFGYEMPRINSKWWCKFNKTFGAFVRKEKLCGAMYKLKVLCKSLYVEVGAHSHLNSYSHSNRPQ